MTMRWIKGKQLDPYQRPRIDWIATLLPFVPFWIGVAFGGVAWLLLFSGHR